MDLGGNTQILSVSNACLGFVNAVTLAAGMIECGQINRAVIVAGENGKPLVDRTIDLLNESNLNRRQIKPYFANLTIGASAVAWSIARRDLIDENAPLLGSTACVTDTSHNELCEGDTEGDGLIMQTDSEELLHAGISVAKRAWKKFTESSGWSPQTPEFIVTHQVGKAHTAAVFESLGLDLNKNFSTYETLGNCGSVSLPSLTPWHVSNHPKDRLNRVSSWHRKRSFEHHVFRQPLKTPNSIKESFPSTGKPSKLRLARPCTI